MGGSANGWPLGSNGWPRDHFLEMGGPVIGGLQWVVHEWVAKRPLFSNGLTDFPQEGPYYSLLFLFY